MIAAPYRSPDSYVLGTRDYWAWLNDNDFVDASYAGDDGFGPRGGDYDPSADLLDGGRDFFTNSIATGIPAAAATATGTPQITVASTPAADNHTNLLIAAAAVLALILITD